MQNVTTDYLNHLVQQSKLPRVEVDQKLQDALARLDYMLEEISTALAVEFYGPFVGVEQREAHRLVVRAHEWKIHQSLWSLKVCVATPVAKWRAEWAIQATSRLRKAIVVAALPEFFTGYSEVIRGAGKDTTPAGRRISDVAARFQATSRP